MRTLFWLTCVLVIALSGCKPRNTATDDNPPASDPACQAITIGNDGRMDAISSATAMVEGDCLHLKAVYGGGCRDHEFKLLWNGNFLKSMPPQVNLTLSHNSNEDHCRSMLNSKESFDLTKLCYEGVGQVVLNIRLPGPQRETIRANYTY